MNPSSSILYYPHIEIHNDRWLKSTLLLWDCVYRIVPSSYTPFDSHPIRAAADHGLVRAITLEKEDLAGVGAEYRSFLDSLGSLPAGLDSDRTESLHKDKIDARLYPALEKLAVRINPDGFLDLPADLSRGYMLYLAKSVSGRRNMPTVTDDRNAWTVSPYFRERANFGDIVYDQDASAFHCSLIFNDLVPASAVDVEIEKIIHFIDARKDERDRLRKTISDFGSEIARCQSASHAADLRADYVSRFEEAKRDFRRSMDFCSKEDRSALVTLGIPAAASVFGALGLSGDPFDMWKIGTTIVMGAVAAYEDATKVKRENRKNSDASYLVDIDEELIKKNAIPRYDRIFEEFIND